MTEWSAVEAALTDPRGRRTPAEFLAADRTVLMRPGLYTWWVDEAGAADLAKALGLPVAAGVIYMGQAGATKPSGRTSSATLWSRISRNHLGGRARSSTLRRTLAGVLWDVLGLEDGDDPKLQAWICRHLRVIAVPVVDVDGLMRLEAVMLAALDPPLNLRDRPSTLLRARVSELRVPLRRPEDDTDDADSAYRGPASGGSAPRGTYRDSDGAKVEFAAARAAWSVAARDVLVGVACRYHAVITYKELAEEVQRAAGIRTGMQVRHWIGGVLERLAIDGAQRQEPMLCALCVQLDGTVGDGYAGAIEVTGGAQPADLDQHAAEERLACHRHFGAKHPADGGRPALTPQVAERRERQRRREVPAPRLCPTCFMELPLSGKRDTCS